MFSRAAAATVRRPAVAGVFYPEEPRVLARDVEAMLARAGAPVPRPGTPKALIVPHAGYRYSGPVAASGYALLRAARGVVRRVVLFGPCHRVPVRGLARPGVHAFQTPLGCVPLDREAIAAITSMRQVEVSGPAHALEHSLEVQLPFLQTVLGDFSLVPLAVSGAAPAQIAAVMERLWGGAETLIVVSSDLSHYLSYGDARAMDQATVDAILALRDDLDHEQACGASSVAGLAVAARAHRLAAEVLDLRNSADVAGGDRARVVGYTSIAFWTPGETAYDADHGKALLALARSSLKGEPAARSCGAGPEAAGPEATEPAAPWLEAERASFVTLTRDGELRGCIGTLTPSRSLGEDIIANARAAASRDPRFAPVTTDEVDGLRIEVSVVSPLVPMTFADEAELLATVEPGRDGLALEYGRRHATFLPQVWNHLPDPGEFLAELRRKAGIPPSTPIERCTVSRYRVVKWREEA
jgi:AmmeMemoRadiSam system protein B/AmmeMemoRadiSam system protein A